MLSLWSELSSFRFFIILEFKLYVIFFVSDGDLLHHRAKKIYFTGLIILVLTKSGLIWSKYEKWNNLELHCTFNDYLFNVYLFPRYFYSYFGLPINIYSIDLKCLYTCLKLTNCNFALLPFNKQVHAFLLLFVVRPKPIGKNGKSENWTQRAVSAVSQLLTICLKSYTNRQKNGKSEFWDRSSTVIKYFTKDGDICQKNPSAHDWSVWWPKPKMQLRKYK